VSLFLQQLYARPRPNGFSYKKDYVIMITSFLNPEGHQNPFSGSKVTAILLKGGFGLLVELQRGGSALQPAQQACFAFKVDRTC
jgi:hypothetical protein